MQPFQYFNLSVSKLNTNFGEFLTILMLLSTSGVIITSLISWALIPRYSCASGLPACHTLPSSNQSAATCCTKRSNYGWRFALFTLGALSVFAFFARFVLFTFYESPKFLVSKGKDREAVEVIRKIALFNRLSPEDAHILSMEDLDSCDRLFHAGDPQDESCTSDESDSRASKGKNIRKKDWKSKSIDGNVNANGNSGNDSDSEAEEGKQSSKFVVRGKQAAGKVNHLATLFSTRAMTRLTVLTWICYAADYW